MPASRPDTVSAEASSPSRVDSFARAEDSISERTAPRERISRMARSTSSRARRSSAASPSARSPAARSSRARASTPRTIAPTRGACPEIRSRTSATRFRRTSAALACSFPTQSVC